MEVFALDLAVRETGAATVERSLGKMRAEAEKVTAGTNRMAQNAAKGSLAMAGLARNIAVSGNAAAALSGGIIESGSHIAMMFGPTGILVGALAIFTSVFTSSMKTIREEVKKTTDAIDADTRRMAATLGSIGRLTDLAGVREGLSLLRGGTGRGVSGTRATAEDIRALGIEGIIRDVRGFSGEMTRLAEAMRTAPTKEQRERYLALADATRRYQAVLTQLRMEEDALIQQENKLLGINGQKLAASNAEVRRTAERIAAIERERTAIQNRERIRAISATLPSNFTKVRPLFSAEQIAEATRLGEIRDTFAQGIASAIVGGFSLGISEAIASGNIGHGFAQLGGAMLAGLGSAMIDFGTAAILASQFVQTIKASLASLNPIVAIAAGAALVGLGAALGGAAQRSFGRMGGTGIGGGAGIPQTTGESVTRIVFGPTTASVAAGLTPRAVNNFTIIGPNDPTAQRAIEELLRKAERRGGMGG